MLPPLIHIICSSLLLSNLIENTPPAAIVCHPPPPSGGATRSSSLFDCCVIVMVWWFVCPRPRGDACSKEPPLFNYCNSVGNCRQGRSNHTHNRPGRTCGNNTVDNCRWCCNIGNREETFVRWVFFLRGKVQYWAVTSGQKFSSRWSYLSAVTKNTSTLT